MTGFGSKELKEDVLSSGRCIGCGACMDLCPYFASYKGKTALLFPCTLDGGKCFALCPKVEVDLDALSQNMFSQPYTTSPLGSYRTVKVAKAGPNARKGEFQSGGTVSALMSFALKTGRIDGAVLTKKEGILPVPCLVTDPDEVYQCSGSKYTAAPTLSALNRAIAQGYRKIGVVGTPCQSLAVAKLRSNPLKEENFTDPVALMVGLFCTWSLDFRMFEPFISKHVNINKIKKLDIPPPPANIFEIYTDKKKIKIPLEDIRQLISESCEFCPDMTSEFSDVSVGVLEGQPDMNTMIIRTEKGEQLVREAEKQGYLFVDDMPRENLDHLIIAAGNKKKNAMEKVDGAGLLNTTDKNRRALFRFSD